MKESARDFVRRLSIRDTKAGPKRELLKALRGLSDGLPEFGLEESTVTRLLSQLDPPVDERASSLAYLMLSDRFLALSYLDVLCREGPRVHALWEQMKRVFLTFADRHLWTGRFTPADPGIARIAYPTTLEGFLSFAGAEMLSFLGLGIRALRGDTRTTPDVLGLDPSLASLFP